MLYWVYQNLLRILKPFLIVGLYIHVRKRGIAWGRFKEIRGRPTMVRDDNHAYVWVHAVSFGETKAALTLVKYIHEHHPDLRFVMTTVTKTAADEVARSVLDYVVHQYLPFDHQTWVLRFLQSWKPLCGIVVEQELWPCLYLEARALNIPIIIVNGHMTSESASKWKKVRGLLKPIFSAIKVVLAQSEYDAAQWRQLGHSNVVNVGNLKFSSPPLPYDPAVYEEMATTLQNRTIWVAASVHAGEETYLAQAHALLRREFSDLLTIVAPRHIEKAPLFVQALKESGSYVGVRSCGDPITDAMDAYVADTHGEMGLWYSLCPLTFLGGSLIQGVGGHNPIEPIQQDCAVVTGLHTENIHELVTQMLQAGALRQAKDSYAIAREVATLLRKPVQLKAITQNGKRFVAQVNPLPEIYQKLRPFFDKKL
ncbi:MAG: 3-deoxy-D-manno-octulosonic acid transferase [Alphaproteobacteria bacterium]|nr:MAG: 3-deoxy-D-manno-octulosonic acid transferase [Alphaproteobacteria bacterium]